MEEATSTEPALLGIDAAVGIPNEPASPTPAVEAATPPATIKKCDIHGVLSPSLIQLLKLAPQNQTARALVTAKLEMALPDSCATYPEIEAYIEFNYVKPNKPSKPEVVAVSSLRWAERQSGTCEWKGTASGDQHIEITSEDIKYLADEAEDMDDFEEKLQELIGERASTDDVEMEMDYENIEHSNHEVTDRDDSDYSIENGSTARDSAVGWLRRNHPRRAEELGL